MKSWNKIIPQVINELVSAWWIELGESRKGVSNMIYFYQGFSWTDAKIQQSCWRFRWACRSISFWFLSFRPYVWQVERRQLWNSWITCSKHYFCFSAFPIKNTWMRFFFLGLHKLKICKNFPDFCITKEKSRILESSDSENHAFSRGEDICQGTLWQRGVGCQHSSHLHGRDNLIRAKAAHKDESTHARGLFKGSREGGFVWHWTVVHRLPPIWITFNTFISRKNNGQNCGV